MTLPKPIFDTERGVSIDNTPRHDLRRPNQNMSRGRAHEFLHFGQYQILADLRTSTPGSSSH